jgi:6-pyruvoyltetrahydropterin/6-carboxytetrahydropterin synthase
MRVAVYRRAKFCAAHRLFRPDWDDAKNDEVFGLCNNPSFHGHNYSLEVKVTGELNPETGYVIDLKVLKQYIREEVEDKFDHKNLNLDCPEFTGLNPTAEHIVVVIYNLLRARIDPSLDNAPGRRSGP